MLSIFTDASNIIKFVAVIAIAYLLGSLNIAIITTKLFTGKDIRTMGSGNAGFTNVMRSVGSVAGVITFVGDFMKCVVAVIVGGLIFSTMTSDTANVTELAGYGKYLGGMFSFLGHLYPVYFKFKGGKGVVTMAALIAVINFPAFIPTLLTFAIIFICTKIISISSIIAAVVLATSNFLVLYLYNFKQIGEVSFEYVAFVSIMTLVMCAVVIIKHKDNIKRLIKGEEKKLTLKKKESKN